jgi:hypothetical protein
MEDEAQRGTPVVGWEGKQEIRRRVSGLDSGQGVKPTMGRQILVAGYMVAYRNCSAKWHATR